MPAKQGKKHMFTILSRMVNHQPASNQTDIKAMQEIDECAKKTECHFYLSDFICDNYESDLDD